MEGLMEQLARNAGDYAAEHYGKGLSAKERADLWVQHYNTAYAAMQLHDELSSARRFRAGALFSEN